MRLETGQTSDNGKTNNRRSASRFNWRYYVGQRLPPPLLRLLMRLLRLMGRGRRRLHVPGNPKNGTDSGSAAVGLKIDNTIAISSLQILSQGDQKLWEILSRVIAETRRGMSVASDQRDNSIIEGRLANHALCSVQDSLGPKHRDVVASAIASAVRTHANYASELGEDFDTRVLNQDGFLNLGPVLSKEQAEEVVAHLRNRLCYAGHVPIYSDGIPRTIEECSKRAHYASYSLEDVLLAPHLLELALKPSLINSVAKYLGGTPTLYSIHAWWTFAQEGSVGVTHRFHRDLDDYRFLSAFVYLTDVASGDGPVEFIRGSHGVDVTNECLRAWQPIAGASGSGGGDAPRSVLGKLARALSRSPFRSKPQSLLAEDLFPPASQNGYSISIDLNSLFRDRVITFVGPAGTAFLADTFALHRGTPPMAKDRLVCWIRYGVSENTIYHNDRTHPIPAELICNRIQLDDRTNYITRLIIQRNNS